MCFLLFSPRQLSPCNYMKQTKEDLEKWRGHKLTKDLWTKNDRTLGSLALVFVWCIPGWVLEKPTTQKLQHPSRLQISSGAGGPHPDSLTVCRAHLLLILSMWVLQRDPAIKVKNFSASNFSDFPPTRCLSLFCLPHLFLRAHAMTLCSPR